ncbi:MmpS family transport accessory protein [Micromonospora sp. CPCC 205556]
MVGVVVALTLAVCGCLGVGGVLLGRYADPVAEEPYPDPYDYEEEDVPEATWTPPPPVQPAQPAVTPSTGAGRFGVRYEVTGATRADIQYYDANGDFIHLEAVPLPWRRSIRTDDPNRVIVIATAEDDGRRVRCSTTVAGRPPVVETAEGSGWRVTCAGS